MYLMAAVFMLLPMTLAAASDGPGLWEKIKAAGLVDCCEGTHCAPNACWVFSNCDSDGDCLKL